MYGLTRNFVLRFIITLCSYRIENSILYYILYVFFLIYIYIYIDTKSRRYSVRFFFFFKSLKLEWISILFERIFRISTRIVIPWNYIKQQVFFFLRTEFLTTLLKYFTNFFFFFFCFTESFQILLPTPLAVKYFHQSKESGKGVFFYLNVTVFRRGVSTILRFSFFSPRK